MKPVQNLLIICKHPNQSAYMQLVGLLKRVSFYTLGTSLSEEEFLRVLDAEGGLETGVIFDDVSVGSGWKGWVRGLSVLEVESEKVKGLMDVLVSISVRLGHHTHFQTFLSVHSVFYNNDKYRLLQK